MGDEDKREVKKIKLELRYRAEEVEENRMKKLKFMEEYYR